MVFFYLQELVAMAVFCSLEIMEIEFSVQILEVAVFSLEMLESYSSVH